MKAAWDLRCNRRDLLDEEGREKRVEGSGYVGINMYRHSRPLLDTSVVQASGTTTSFFFDVSLNSNGSGVEMRR